MTLMLMTRLLMAAALVDDEFDDNFDDEDMDDDFGDGKTLWRLSGF